MGIIKYFFDLLLPERCIICGKIITDKTNHNLICSACEAILTPIKNNVCTNCGLPLISEIKECLRCRSIETSYLSNRSLFKYSGDIKEVIYQYKFNNRKRLSYYFAYLLSEVLFKNYPDSIIIPVPGRRIVRKNKGWEHIDLIGKILKRKYKLPVQKLLVRKGKKAQKTLSREKRAENLQKNISLRKKIKTMPDSVVMLDDVLAGIAGGLLSAILLIGIEKLF